MTPEMKALLDEIDSLKARVEELSGMEEASSRWGAACMDRAQKAESENATLRASLAEQVAMSARLAGNLRGYVEHYLTDQAAHTRHERARAALIAYNKALTPEPPANRKEEGDGE